MKNILIITLTFITLSSYAQVGQKNFIDQPYLEVTGTAELEIVPDEIYLKIIVSENDDKTKQSLLEKEKAMIQTMKKLGIDVEQDFSIKDFASNFNNSFFSKTDIVASKAYQLIVHDSQTLAKFFMEMETLGVSNISIVRVDHSKIEEYKEQVKIEAIKAGKGKAKYLATAMEQHVGKALFVQENNYQPYRNQIPQATNMGISMKVMDSEMGNDVPEIAFEKIKLTSSMLMRFELKE